jgi:iron complex transport system ATP-binding protein
MGPTARYSMVPPGTPWSRPVLHGPATIARVRAPTLVSMAGARVRRGGAVLVGPVDWTILPGQRWVVLGPNGSGKTTLLSLLSTYLPPSDGRVTVLDSPRGAADLRELRLRIGYASPALTAQVSPELATVDVVMTARRAALGPWWHAWTETDRAAAHAALARMGVDALGDRRFGTLSTGERQRALIARALVVDPDLLLLDEPAAGLDLGAREALVERLSALALARRPAGIVLVTHHVEEIPSGFDHALLLAGGRVVAAGPASDVLTGSALSTAFGLPLTVDRADGRFGARRTG